MTAKSVAVQKTVVDLTHPGSVRPGDVLAYTVRFQVSDFFAFQNVLATDVFSDGQHYDATFLPTLSFTRHGVTSPSASFQPADVNLGAQNTTDGSTTVTFNVSGELAARGFAGGDLLGGSIPAGGTGGPTPPPTPAFGGTTGTIVFHTVVQQQFDYNYPSGEAFVDEGDALTNAVTASGAVLAYANLSADGSDESDASGTSVSVPRGTLGASI